MTQADLHYVGSVTTDQGLVAASDILPGELAHIDNGARLETYTMAARSIPAELTGRDRLVHGDLVHT